MLLYGLDGPSLSLGSYGMASSTNSVAHGWADAVEVAKEELYSEIEALPASVAGM